MAVERPKITQNSILSLAIQGREQPVVVKGSLGAGAMGEVYKTVLSDGKEAALKVEMPGVNVDAETTHMAFLAERDTLLKLTSPHIIKLHGSGALPDGRLYNILEFAPYSFHQVDLNLVDAQGESVAFEEEQQKLSTIAQIIDGIHFS